MEFFVAICIAALISSFVAVFLFFAIKRKLIFPSWEVISTVAIISFFSVLISSKNFMFFLSRKFFISVRNSGSGSSSINMFSTFFFCFLSLCVSYGLWDSFLIFLISSFFTSHAFGTSGSGVLISFSGSCIFSLGFSSDFLIDSSFFSSSSFGFRSLFISS